MKSETTWAALGVLAVASTVGISLQTGNRGTDRRSAPGDIRQQSHAQSTPNTTSEEERACADLVQTLERFLDVPRLKLPPSCQPAASNGSKEKSAQNQGDATPAKSAPVPDLKFVIATLPDPIHTHLPLMFDRLTEVMQEAAQDEGYSYDASWLPWEDKEQNYLRLDDDDRAEDRKDKKESQPGIFVFRNNSPGNPTEKSRAASALSNPAVQPFRQGLVVFVVGEDPTHGIHNDQFKNALEWIDALRAPAVDQQQPHVVILGPSFSGSFPSLAELIEDGVRNAADQRKKDQFPSPLPIYSGSANSLGAIAIFERTMNPQPPTLKALNPAVDFRTFLQYDETGLGQYCNFARDELGIRVDEIAVISEDETAFGSESETPGGKANCLREVLWLYYPRDISALRAAYQTNSIFSAGAPQAAEGAGRAGHLPTDLADPEGKDHDTIRSYAGNQIPLSQEAYLLGLVNTMRIRHSQYVILRSTNPLDQLFLARYLRRSYPDARIVLDGSDRLFERERSATEMGGTMSLSTYPLLEREQQWIDGVDASPAHRLFNSDNSEGTYIALRMLLHTRALNDGADACRFKNQSTVQTAVDSLPFLPVDCNDQLKRQSKTQIPDYGTPAWMVPEDCAKPETANPDQCAAWRRPPMWLSVVGRDGYWPVTAQPLPPAQLKTKDDKPREDRKVSSPEGVREEVPVSFGLWVTLVGCLVLFHLWCCCAASFTAKPAFRTHFVNFDDPPLHESPTVEDLPAGAEATQNLPQPAANPAEHASQDKKKRRINDPLQHLLLVVLGSWFVALLALLIGWASGVFDPRGALLLHPFWTLSLVALEFVGAFAAPVLNILRIWKLRSRNRLPTRPDSHFLPVIFILLCFASFAIGSALFYVFFVDPLCKLTLANRFFSYYRSLHILNGVSPVVPPVLLSLGMYAWFWHSLHGLALFGPDRCKLPSGSDLLLPDPAHPKRTMQVLRMFSQEYAADATEEGAKPFARVIVRLVPFLSIVLTALVIVISHTRIFADPMFANPISLNPIFLNPIFITPIFDTPLLASFPLRSLGLRFYAFVLFGCLVFCISLMLAQAWQLVETWARLRELLVFLDRMPLRRTLAALRGFSWGTVWGMSGNVLDVRYKLLSRQLESLRRTATALKEYSVQQSRLWVSAHACMTVLQKCAGAREQNPDDKDRLAQVDECLDRLKQLRDSTSGELQLKIDAVRDLLIAHRLEAAVADQVSRRFRDCVSALEEFVSSELNRSHGPEKICIEAIEETLSEGTEFARWYADNYHTSDAGDLGSLRIFQESVAKTTGVLLVKLLLLEWREESESLILQTESGGNDKSKDDEMQAPPLSKKRHIRDAEECVCLPYLGFVQNMLGRIRSIVMSILFLFVATAAAISSYPFDPRQGLSGTMLVLFVILGVVISYVYAQMHKDATLSHVTNTKPGELGIDFWFKLFGVGIAPLLGLLTTVFPEIADFVFSWLQPGLQAVK